MQKSIHFLDGKWVQEKDLVISAFDLSVVRGFGVFDFLRTYGNRPFMFNAHIKRLFNSARLMGMNLPYNSAEIEKIITKGIAQNDFPETNIKIILTGGVGVDGMTPGKPSFVVMFTPAVNYPKEYYHAGVKIVTVPFVRTMPKAKSLNYLMAIIALQTARKQGAVEALYIDDRGAISECTTSNFFAVKDGAVYSPTDNVLFGVTRQVIKDLCCKINIPFVERNVYVSDITDWDESFIAASNKEVMPVVKIDGKKVGSGKVGTLTKRIMKAFKELTEKN